MKTIKICPFCKGLLADFWHTPSYSKCVACELVIANPLPDREDLDKLYKRAWEDSSRNTSETGSMDSELAHQYISELFRKLELTKSENSLRILDFGAGRGALLRELEKRKRIEVFGVEPYGWKKLAHENLNVYPSLYDIPFDLVFDGIISMDVVEHMHAPWKVFRNLNQRLKPGGWLCVSTPNPFSLNARIRGAKWREAQKPGHILFMCDSTLIKMLKSAGFSPVQSMNWRIRFKDSVLRDAVRNILQLFGLGGATRVIAFRS